MNNFAGPPPIPNFSQGMSRDAFGICQVFIVTMVHGKISGIDSSNRDIIWSRMSVMGWAAEIKAAIQPVKLFMAKMGGDERLACDSDRRSRLDWWD